ncbi:TPA: hypothetical protein GFY13_08475 [Escherichia coli]|nr:hypothetical protein [Escherichia coli]HAH3018795.1 hypothetical protein [Escherichia coli]
MNSLQILSFVGFTLLVAVITWWKVRKIDTGSQQGYFLAGRSLKAPVIAASLMLTNLSTEQLIGLSGQAYKSGMSVMGWEVTSAVTLIFLALIFLPRYLKRGIATIPDFLEERYDKTTRIIIDFCFLIATGVCFLPIVLYSGALALNSLFHVGESLQISHGAAIWLLVILLGLAGISYDEPHHPFTCPVEYLEKYADFYYDLGEKAQDDLANKPEHHRLWAQAMPSPVGDDGLYHHPLYFACNDFVDDQIGRVINALTPEQRENTWVIYTSDHGEMMGAHKLISKGAAMYDDITRIPLIIRSPQGERRQVDTPVSHIDLLPTMMALADIEKPEILPGENILAVKEPRGVMVEFNRYEIEHDSFGGFIPVRCWVTDDFKLVLNLFTSDELYDRRNDPNEMHNLIDDIRFADVRSKMHDALLDYMDKIRDPFRSYQWSLRPWRKDALPRWMGAFRPRPQDGYSPVVRDYDTGLPTQGVKVEEKKQKF